ncbi:STAS domain-containing protein [Natronosalvus caseinilyticus]|uniref:STAS domain-containing protein n=1 Tax=Natronosalvus caseinilyticus TaxID=2953747 RepID=UPI0028A65EAF|nr:STAS domain-containing protein [Natronosalvus caseinilyticus]
MSPSDPPYEKLIENAPIGIFRVPVDDLDLEASQVDSENQYANQQLARMLSFDSVEQLRSEISSIEYADPQDGERLEEQLKRTGRVDAFETQLIANDGETVDVLISGTVDDGEFIAYVTDISERKRLERKTAEQAEAILEQSTPIVEIWDCITLATVVGTLDTARAQRLTEELLTELTENGAEIALIDITGVPNVDTATAQHLTDTVNAVSLLGSEVIITGINPNIAQTLVQLGITMDDIRTRSTLSEGLELGLHLTQNIDIVTNASQST